MSVTAIARFALEESMTVAVMDVATTIATREIADGIVDVIGIAGVIGIAAMDVEEMTIAIPEIVDVDATGIADAIMDADAATTSTLIST